MGPYGSDPELVHALLTIAMIFLITTLVLEYIAARRDRD